MVVDPTSRYATLDCSFLLLLPTTAVHEKVVSVHEQNRTSVEIGFQNFIPLSFIMEIPFAHSLALVFCKYWSGSGNDGSGDYGIRP